MDISKVYIQYILLIVLTYFITFVIVKILRKILDVLIRKNSNEIHEDPTNFIFVKNSLSFVLYSIATFWIFHKIPYFNSLGNALFAGAGVIAAVIGFASQKAFSNIIGGLFVLLFKPFRVGDVIEISNNKKGIVEEITLRHTVIKDYENRRIVIPNSQISDETIINSSITDDKIRKHIEVSISYGSDIDLAIDLLRKQITNHPLFLDNRTEEEIKNNQPSILIRVVNLGDWGITLRANVWAENNDHAFTMQCDTYYQIKKTFDNNGIEIPYPYSNVILKKEA